MTPSAALAFLGEPGTTTAGQLFIYMLMFVVPGIAVFGVGVAKERDGGKPWVKYVSIVFFGLAAWVGFPFTMHLLDDFASSAIPIGGTSLHAYRLAFPGPVLLILGVLIYGFVSSRLRKRAEEY